MRNFRNVPFYKGLHLSLQCLNPKSNTNQQALGRENPQNLERNGELFPIYCPAVGSASPSGKLRHSGRRAVNPQILPFCVRYILPGRCVYCIYVHIVYTIRASRIFLEKGKMLSQSTVHFLLGNLPSLSLYQQNLASF